MVVATDKPVGALEGHPYLGKSG